MTIEPIDPQNDEALLALNNDHAEELSFLTQQEFRRMADEAFCALRVGEGDALLLAFDQEGDYQSPNFLWFKTRYPRFVYVDRIVVSPNARGRGLARLLYEELFRRAGEAGHERICCEVNAEPPNPASDAFHAALGFEEVGQAAIHDGKKTVRYFVRPL